uniref:Hexosyltransferase n=1 Tax=Petromyzon marinus TaxID=7757 RepID=S4RJ46_PETMA
IKILFLLGSIPALTKVDPLDLQQQLEEESHRHRDLLQQNFVDAYDNLTLKTMMGLHWVYAHCPHAAYVMKTDSDMFVNLEVLAKFVLKPELPSRPDYFTGCPMNDFLPICDKNSWYISPEEFPGERYPQCCSGTGYASKSSMSNRSFHPERAFSTKVPFSVCKYNNLVTSHQIPPPELRRYWQQLQHDKNSTCRCAV